MAFLDAWGFLGTGIQSAFAWIAYNRDAFADNVSMRQNQKYQQKNYQISWIAIARDDIRDMMGISVNRINNYMIVATLILSISAGSIVSVSFNERCPSFVVFAFYLSLSISCIYLMLAIMFGVKGQNSAFTNTMKLMTYQVRPENPAEYSHDYLKQAQYIEKCGLKALFRMPGLQPNYHVEEDWSGFGERGAVQSTKQDGQGLRQTARPAVIGRSAEAPKTDEKAGRTNLEDATPLESLFKRTTHTWYLTKFAQFMRLWQPYDTYSKYSMGLGIVCLGQGSAYFFLGHLVSQTRYLSEWAAIVLVFAFVYMVVLVTLQNFKARDPLLRLALFALLTAGPTLAAIGAVTPHEPLRLLVVPLCFAAHLLFWVLALKIAWQELTDKTLDFSGEFSFWGKKKDDDEESQRQGDERPEQWNPAPCQETSESAEKRRCAAACNSQAAAGASREEAQRSVSDHWPTDDDEFADKASSTSVYIRQTVRCTVFISGALWFAMFLWAAVVCWVEPLFAMKQEVEVPLVAGPAVDMEVLWPSPLFRPTTIACAGIRVFAADGFRVFELFPTIGSRSALPAEEVPCGLERPIVGLTAFCDLASSSSAAAAPGLCRPMALVRGAGNASAVNEVVECGPGGARPLLQDSKPAGLVAAFPQGSAEDPQRLVSAREGELVQFVASADGWAPEWNLGAVPFFTPGAAGNVEATAQAGEAAVGVAASGGRLLLFRASGDARHSIEARSLQTLAVDGRWLLPPGLGPIASGCAWDKANAIVLPAGSSSSAASTPRLVRVALPPSGSSK